MNISVKIQLIPHIASKEMIFLKYFVQTFSLFVAMTTNQIKKFG